MEFKPPKEWTTEGLINLLQEKTSNRLPGMMKKVSRDFLLKQNPRYILDRGYKIDYLIHSGKLEGYIGVDFMLYPRDKEWDKYLEKIEGILDLHKKGVYEVINVKRMGVLLVQPETPHCVVDEELKEAQEDKVFEFFDSVESYSEFLAPTKILDLRENWEYLDPPP
jgi:hypothetical protein